MRSVAETILPVNAHRQRHARGFKAARFWAMPIDERFEKVGTYELYRVGCNLVNGLPPGWPYPPR
jgi:hypothetical protein